jgi:hypothetical protein
VMKQHGAVAPRRRASAGAMPHGKISKSPARTDRAHARRGDSLRSSASGRGELQRSAEALHPVSCRCRVPGADLAPGPVLQLEREDGAFVRALHCAGSMPCAPSTWSITAPTGTRRTTA